MPRLLLILLLLVVPGLALAGWCDEPWQCGGVQPIVDIPLTTSLVPRKGTTLSSYTRASAATQITGGILSQVDVNAPRFEDGWFLSEGASQNDILYSEPTSVAQAAADSNVTYAAYAWACGLLTRDVVFGDDSAARSITFAVTVTTTDVWTLSMFVVMDDAGTPVIGPPTTETADLYFSVGDDGGTRGASTATQLGTSAIWRVSQTITSTDGVDTVTFGKATTNSAKGFKASGFQAEKKAFVSSYIPTTGSAVARAVDSTVLYAITPAITAAFSTGTFITDMLVWTSQGASARPFCGSNTDGNGIAYIVPGNFPRTYDGTTAFSGPTALTLFQPSRFSLRWSTTNERRMAVKNLTVGTTSTATGAFDGAHKLETALGIFGNGAGADQSPLKVRNWKLFGKELSDAQITKLLNKP